MNKLLSEWLTECPPEKRQTIDENAALLVDQFARRWAHSWMSRLHQKCATRDERRYIRAKYSNKKIQKREKQQRYITTVKILSKTNI